MTAVALVFLAVNFTFSGEVCRWNRKISAIYKSRSNIYQDDSGRNHKARLPFGGQFVQFLGLNLCFIHKINSKIAITVFMFKAWFLLREKICLCGLLFTELWCTFSRWKPILAKMLRISFLSLEESHKKYTQKDQFLSTWYFWPKSTRSVLTLQKKKCWSQKDQVLYLLKNDPVEFVVTL